MSSDISFVRHDTIPESPPPAAETGAVKWMRENLFSGWLNTLLTVAAIYIIVRIVIGVFPWFANGVWDADNLAECRTILDGATGACFAVLVERWPQLLYGISYPADGYWRPTLAFILLFPCVAPALFARIPRKFLIATAIFPFLAYWLIWGGTILSPIITMIALIAGYFAFLRAERASGFFMGLVAGVATAAVLMFIGGFITSALSGFIALPEVASRDMGGFMLNMVLGTVCVSLSLPLGILLALGRQSSMPIIKGICVIFIEFIRGVPLITLLFIANVVLAYFFPVGASPDLILRVIIMITIFSAAYIAEVIRGGLAALPKGQYEAGDSMGLNYSQSMRLIILPQALKISIPGIVNVAVGLFKDTTLVSVISMFDLVGAIRGPILSSTSWTGIYWEAFIFAALLFFVICYGISQYSQWLERQLATDHR